MEYRERKKRIKRKRETKKKRKWLGILLARNLSWRAQRSTITRERWLRISVSEVRQRVIRHDCAITRKEKCLRIGCQDVYTTGIAVGNEREKKSFNAKVAWLVVAIINVISTESNNKINTDTSHRKRYKYFLPPSPYFIRLQTRVIHKITINTFNTIHILDIIMISFRKQSDSLHINNKTRNDRKRIELS